MSVTYCDPQDLLERLSEADQVSLAADAGGETWSDPSVQERLARIILQAQGVIDGYLGAVMPVPLAAPHGLVRGLCADMAVYFLFRRRGATPETWEETYKRSLRTLERIAEGKLSLGPAEGGETAPAEPTDRVLGVAPRPLFGEDAMRRFLG